MCESWPSGSSPGIQYPEKAESVPGGDCQIAQFHLFATASRTTIGPPYETTALAPPWTLAEKDTAISTRLAGNLWFFVRWGILLVILGGVLAWPFLTNRIDEEIRLRVVEKFTKGYPTLTTEVRSAQLVHGEGIRLKNIIIRDPANSGPAGELANYEEIFLTCPTGLSDLMQADLPIEKILVRNLRVRATKLPDGSWSAVKLLPLPKFSEHCAESITLENAAIDLIDPTREPALSYTLKNVNVTLSPQAGHRDLPAEQRTMEVRGTITCDHLQKCEVAAVLAPQGQGWRIAGTMQGIDVCPDLCCWIPSEYCALEANLAALRGEVDAAFDVSSPPDQSGIRFSVQAQLRRGRIEDPRLPFTFNDVTAVLSADNEGVTLKEFTARNGSSTFRLSGHMHGFRPDSRIELAGQARHLLLDRPSAEGLPGSIHQLWKRFEPTGTANADFSLTFDGQRWRPEAHVECLDVAFVFDKFPYRLERGTGRLDLIDDKMVLHMTAFGGGQPLRIDGEFLNPGPNFTGWFEARGRDLPFDENLFQAIPGKSQEVIRSLNPSGTFQFSLRSWRDDPTAQKMHHKMQVQLKNCMLKYDKFPYPLMNIHGTLDMEDHRWTFNDLEGTNDSGVVRAQGRLAPINDSYEFTMSLTGTEVPFEEELRDALKPDMQKLWNDMRPRGAMDLIADMKFVPDRKEFDLTLRGEPHGDVSIEPTFFPYRLEQLKGRFTYHDGHAEFTNIRATHGRVTLAGKGVLDFKPQGPWKLNLQELNIDRLRMDRDALLALPSKLRKVMTQLNPQGPMNLRGQLILAGASSREPTVQSSWDMEVNMQQGSLDCGIKLQNVFGGVRLTGTFDGQHTASHGELSVDSLTYKDLQFTEILGPLWIDDERILLGGGAERPTAGKPPRRVTAKSYGATLVGDCAVVLGPTPRYSLRATMADGDLSRFAHEAMSGKQKLNGRLFGNVELAGNGQGTHTLAGHGQVQLRDADLLELPVIVSLLKILSVRAPDKTAFTGSDIDFRIEGEHVYFDRLELTGDAISLVGKGEMGFDTALNLKFHSVVGRSDYQLPVLKNMLGQASQQFMLIHVDGTLANPHTRTEAFPGINQAMQQMQANQQQRRDERALRQ